MTAEERDQERLDAMATLQNEITTSINKAQLPYADIFMILRVLTRQIEDGFMRKVQIT